MPIKFRKAQQARFNGAITSAQYNSLAGAFNDRLKAGAGDPSWRIFWYAHSLVRNLRNPQIGAVAGGDSWPADDEWWKLYSHVDNGVACSGETYFHWPITEPGSEGGINVGSPLGAFIYGVEDDNSIYPESERLTFSVGDTTTNHYFGNTAPIALTNVANTDINNCWVAAKRQRGYIEYLPYTGTAPAIETAHTHNQWTINDLSPWLKAPTSFMPAPASSSTCPKEYGGVYPPKWTMVFTPLITTKPKLTFGTCPGVDGDVQYITYDSEGYSVYRQGRDPLFLSYAEYIEGPYTGGGTIGKEKGGQIGQIVNKYVSEFRGNLQARQNSDLYARGGGLFDFQTFMTSQYSLAPAFSSYNSSGVKNSDIYPFFTLNTAGVKAADTTFPCNQGGSSYSCNGVLGAFLVSSKGVKNPSTGTVEISIYSANFKDAVYKVPIPVNTTVDTYYAYYLPVAVHAEDITVTVSGCTIDTGGYIKVELLDQVPYIPDINDAYLIIRLASTLGSEDMPDVTGLEAGLNASFTAKEIWDDYSTYRCLLNNKNILTTPDYPLAINWNSIYDSARRLINDNLRMVPRQQLVKYEVVDGKSNLYFYRSYLGNAISHELVTEEKLYPVVPKISTEHIASYTTDKLITEQEYLVVADKLRGQAALPIQTQQITGTFPEISRNYSVRWPLYKDATYWDSVAFTPLCTAFLIYAGVKYAPPGYNAFKLDGADDVANKFTAVAPKTNTYTTEDKTLTTTDTDVNGIITTTITHVKRVAWTETNNVTLLPSDQQKVNFESYANGWRYTITKATVEVNTTGKIKYDKALNSYYYDDVDAYGTSPTYVITATPHIDIQPNPFGVAVTPYVRYFPVRLSWTAAGDKTATGKYTVNRIIGATTTAIGTTSAVTYLDQLIGVVSTSDISYSVTYPKSVGTGTITIAPADIIAESSSYIVESAQNIPIQDSNFFSYSELDGSVDSPKYTFYGDANMGFEYTDKDGVTITGGNGDILIWDKDLNPPTTSQGLKYLYLGVETTEKAEQGVFVLTYKGDTGITGLANQDSAYAIQVITESSPGVWDTITTPTINRFEAPSSVSATLWKKYKLNTGYEILSKAIYQLPIPSVQYKVLGTGYITYDGADYYAGDIITANTVLDYTPSDITTSLAQVVSSSCSSGNFDSFLGMAPDFALGEKQLFDGVTYMVFGTGGITYRTDTTPTLTMVSAGSTFTWASTYHSLLIHDGASIRQVEGISATAPKKGLSNQWNMFLSTFMYHPSVSSNWKTDVYGDILTFLHNRCHTYAPELPATANKDINNQLTYGSSIALRSEAPPGYTYIKNVNTTAVENEYTKNFYKSCQIYKPDYEIESITVETVASVSNTEIVKVRLKTRLDYYNDGTTAIATTDVSNVAFQTKIKAQPYRTDENAVLEYLMRDFSTSTGTPHCANMIGDQALNGDVWNLPDNPFGSCMPRFYFTKQIPYVYEDNNVISEEHDSLATVTPFMQMEFYLRAMCSGYLDMDSLEAVNCSTGLAISPVADYTFENLVYQAARPIGATIDPDVSAMTELWAPKKEVTRITSVYTYTWSGVTPTSCEYRFYDLDNCEWSDVDSGYKPYAAPIGSSLIVSIPFSDNIAYRYQFRFKDINGAVMTGITEAIRNTVTLDLEKDKTYTLWENYLTTANCTSNKPTEAAAISTNVTIPTDITGINYTELDKDIIRFDYIISNPVFAENTKVAISYSFAEPLGAELGIYVISWNSQPRAKYEVQRKITYAAYETVAEWVTVASGLTLPVYYDIPPVTPTFTKEVTNSVEPVFSIIDGLYASTPYELDSTEIDTINGGGFVNIPYTPITNATWSPNRLYYIYRTLTINRMVDGTPADVLTYTADPILATTESALSENVALSVFPIEIFNTDTVTISYTAKYKSGLTISFDKLDNHTALVAGVSHLTEPSNLVYKIYQTSLATTEQSEIVTTSVYTIANSATSPYTFSGLNLPANFDLVTNDTEEYKVVAEWNDYRLSTYNPIEYVVIATTKDRVKNFCSMPAAFNVRKPQGYGPLPNTSLYTEIFNNYVNCINKLTHCRVELPLTIRQREIDIDTDLTGTTTIPTQHWVTLKTGLVKTGVTTYSNWVNTTDLTELAAFASFNPAAGKAKDGAAVPQYHETQYQFNIPPKQPSLEAVPVSLRSNFNFNNLMFYGSTTKGTVVDTYESTEDETQSTIKCGTETNIPYPIGSTTYIKYTAATPPLTTSCVRYTGGLITAPPLPNMEYDLKAYYETTLDCKPVVGGSRSSMSVATLRPLKYMTFGLS